jgi:transposase-like protein
MQCDRCGGEQLPKAGHDRAGRLQYRYRPCRRRLTARTTSAFCGFGFPDDIIAVAVRWYLRLRLPFADIVELLAERGIQVDRSNTVDWST